MSQNTIFSSLRIILSSMFAAYFYNIATSNKIYDGVVAVIFNDAYIPWILCAACGFVAIFEIPSFIKSVDKDNEKTTEK